MIATLPALRRMLPAEPLIRVSPEQPLDDSLLGKARGLLQLARERAQAQLAPGHGIGLNTLRDTKSTHKLADERARHPEELAIPTQGLALAAGRLVATEVANPDRLDGRWDPAVWAPTLHFDAREDSFPVLPGFDADTDWRNDAEHYEHGMVGGPQGVTTNFAVARKGEYYVLQYNYYYVDNKVGGAFHLGDWTSVSIYLKPGARGPLEPAFVYTSWHHGALMAPWSQVQQDAKGHPQVRVGRGSHSAIALRPGQRLEPDGGLVLHGDGRMGQRGSSRPLAHRNRFTTFQPNVEGAHALDPATPLGSHAADLYYGWHPERVNPVHPSLFGFERPARA